MFTKLASFSVLAAVLSSAFASPIDLSDRSSHHQVSFPSFNEWHGIKSLHGFDKFYGKHNFAGISRRQVVLKQKKELVCRRQQIDIIQQRLVVLREMAKKIITETICEVETQTIVFEQFHAGLGYFRHDLSRKSGRHVGYDAHIAGLYHGIFNKDGSLTDYDLGFRGSDVGKHVIVPSGNNWNPHSSPPIIEDAYKAAKKAISVTGDCEADGSCDDGEPPVKADAEPDIEVDGPAEAPPVEAADAEAADAEGADAEAADAEGADAEAADAEGADLEAADAEGADAEGAEGADAEASGSATVSVAANTAASSEAAAPTTSANTDPATAP